MIAVVGPTGSGKSDLAVSLALELGGEVINADSMQFYRGMDIGTAKITEAERRGVPHHLLDILDVTEEASVSDFQQQARAADRRHPRPRQAGHPGRRLRALRPRRPRRPGVPRHGPGHPRAGSRRNWHAAGPAPLRTRLEAVDPVSAGRLGDARRIVRALEVFELTGRPFSSFMPAREYFQPAVQIGLEVDRELLQRAARPPRPRDGGPGTARRSPDGWTPPGSGAAGPRPGPSATPSSSRSSTANPTWTQAAEETIIATRQFARRQLTWFRADPRITWLDWQDPDLVAKAAAPAAGRTAGAAVRQPRP